MVKTSRKNLKRKNKYNSKKLNQKAGGKKNKHVIYLGYTNHQSEENTYEYLKNQLKIKDSNQGESISILFSITDPSLFLTREYTTLNSRNTIHNFCTGIKLVEDKFNAGLLYRENKPGSQEENYIKYIKYIPEQFGGSKNVTSLLRDLSNISPTANNMINGEALELKNLREEIISNPLHGIKKMQDGKNLHLIMFLKPQPTSNPKYKIEYLNNLLTTNSGDYFIVLFPCLKKERTNNLNIKGAISEIEKIGFNKENTEFKTDELETTNKNYNYNYCVYTKNLDSNFDLKIKPHTLASSEDSPSSTPLSTPSGNPNQSIASSNPQNLEQRLAALRAQPTKPKTPRNLDQLISEENYKKIEVTSNGDCFFDSVCRCLGTINDNENGEIKKLKERFGSTNTANGKIKGLRELFVNSFTVERFNEFYNLMGSAATIADNAEKTHQEAYRDDVVFSRDEYLDVSDDQGKIENYKSENNIADNQTLSKSDFKEYLKTNHFWANERVINDLRLAANVEIIVIEDEDLKVAPCHGSNDENKLTNPHGFITIVYMTPKEIQNPDIIIKTGGHYVPLFYENKGFFKTANDVPDLIKRLISRSTENGGCVSFNLASYFNS